MEDCVIHHIMSNMVNDTVGEVVDSALRALCSLQRCITETCSPCTNIECFHSGFPLLTVSINFFDCSNIQWSLIIVPYIMKQVYIYTNLEH